jgi:hypothetical protein
LPKVRTTGAKIEKPALEELEEWRKRNKNHFKLLSISDILFNKSEFRSAQRLRMPIRAENDIFVNRICEIDSFGNWANQCKSMQLREKAHLDGFGSKIELVSMPHATDILVRSTEKRFADDETQKISKPRFPPILKLDSPQVSCFRLSPNEASLDGGDRKVRDPR